MGYVFWNKSKRSHNNFSGFSTRYSCKGKLRLTQDYSQKITSKFGSQDSVLDKGQFDQFCHEFGIDAESDIDVIKKYLVSTKQLYHKTEQGVWACKFGAEVVESDFGILKIKKTMKVLQGIISDMEVEIQKAKAEAKMLVALGLNTRALYNLRVAKKLDHVLQQRLSSLDTLDNLLSKINQSKTQIEIMSAYEVGTKTLKDILKKDELSLENVQDTMDALSDVLEDHEEISNAIANTEDFEEELEIELEAMIQADASTPPTPISASGQLYGSGIIPQQGSPIRLKGSDSKIGTPNMRMKVMAGSGSHLGSTRSSDKESELEARLDQLKMSTTPPAPLKSKKKVAEMLPAE